MAEFKLSDEKIIKRLQSYNEQDKKAGRDVCLITLEQARTLLSPPAVCSHCNYPVSRSNWSFDRIDNSKGHSFDNLVLSCHHCNVKKKDSEGQVAHLDLETFP